MKNWFDIIPRHPTTTIPASQYKRFIFNNEEFV